MKEKNLYKKIWVKNMSKINLSNMKCMKLNLWKKATPTLKIFKCLKLRRKICKLKTRIKEESGHFSINEK